MRGDWQKGHDFKPDMVTLPRKQGLTQSFSARARTQAQPLVESARDVDTLLSDVRLFIYAQMVNTSAAPSVAETARGLAAPPHTAGNKRRVRLARVDRRVLDARLASLQELP
jgi:hypothetical protein